MDSESGKDAPGVPKKLKFKPRGPPRRVIKQEVKNEVVDDVNAEAERAAKENLLKRFHERESAMKAKLKTEKKVLASQIAFGYGGDSTSIKSSYGIPRGRSNISINQNSASSGGKEKEYQEPWDYYSNYPITVPLRRPYSGNPALLDEEEFGEAAESRTYDENASNSAMELGLFEENLEASMFLINLPSKLPPLAKEESATAGGKDVNVKSKPHGNSKNVEELCELNKLPSGFMGKMLVYKSGAIKLKLGNILYDVSSGMNCVFAEDLVAVNSAEKHCCSIGEISKHVTITPDVDAIFDN